MKAPDKLPPPDKTKRMWGFMDGEKGWYLNKKLNKIKG